MHSKDLLEAKLRMLADMQAIVGDDRDRLSTIVEAFDEEIDLEDLEWITAAGASGPEDFHDFMESMRRASDE